MTKDETMRMALDALNNFDSGNHGMRWQVPVIKALRTALAQPEPEPVAWVNQAPDEITISLLQQDGFDALYTAPPQRKPLSEAFIVKCVNDYNYDFHTDGWGRVLFMFGKNQILGFARAIEAAHDIG